MKFTPEMFLGNGGSPVACSRQAQAAFDAWLMEQPEVYGFKGFKEIVWHLHPVGGDSHIARLVDICEPVQRGPVR